MDSNDGDASEPVHLGTPPVFMYSRPAQESNHRNTVNQVLRLGRVKCTHIGHSDYQSTPHSAGTHWQLISESLGT